MCRYASRRKELMAMRAQYEAQKKAAADAAKETYAPPKKLDTSDPQAVKAEAVRREAAKEKKRKQEKAKAEEIRKFKEEAVAKEKERAKKAPAGRSQGAQHRHALGMTCHRGFAVMAWGVWLSERVGAARRRQRVQGGGGGQGGRGLCEPAARAAPGADEGEDYELYCPRQKGIRKKSRGQKKACTFQ